MSFSVSLPGHHFQVEYDYEKFTKEFPNSLITKALELCPGEKVVPLDNPVLTPTVFHVLEDILNTNTYSYVEWTQIQKQLDYLGIDLPEFVYSPVYRKFIRDYPINVRKSEDLNKHYEQLLNLAAYNELLSLVDYMFEHTRSEDHTTTDANMFNHLVGMAKPSVFAEELAKRIFSTRHIAHRDYLPYIIRKGYLSLYQIYEAKHGKGNPSASVGHLLANIVDYPEDFYIYATALLYIIEDPDPHKDYPEICRMFKGVYNGDMGLDIRIQHLNPHYNQTIACGLLWTAVLRRHSEVYTYLLTRWKDNVPVWVKLFFQNYREYKDLVHPEMRQVVEESMTIFDS